jgi:hypothetical protein
MKRILFLSFAFIALNTISVSAQMATSSTIEILKGAQPCVMATFPFSEDLLMETIKLKMERAKLDGPDKAKGGFKVYKAASYADFGNEKFDIYFKTDGKKESSICYMALSRGYDNFVNKDKDEVVFLAMMDYMNSLKEDAAKVKLGHDIEDAQEANAKAEKTYNNSVNDGKDYEKDLEKLKKKIEDNKAAQEKLMKEWNDAKTKLQELKAQQ